MWLQLELDAKKKLQQVARVVGMSPGDVTWGMCEAWEYCFWVAKKDVVSRLELEGLLVNYSERQVAALEAFGFLEATDGGWRVKGGDRYEKAREARARGGRASRGNLRQFAGSAPAAAGVQPEVQPANATGCAPAEPRAESPEPISLPVVVAATPARGARQQQQQQQQKVEASGEAAQEAWECLQQARTARGLPAETRPPRGFEAWEAEARAQVGPDGVLRAYLRYLDSPDFARGGWPMGVFLRPTVWLPRAGEGRPRRDALTGVAS